MKQYLTRKIMQVIIKNRSGMTARQIEALINTDPDDYYADFQVIRVELCRLVNANKVSNEGKHACPTCHSENSVYRITDTGRTYVADYGLG